MKKFTKIMSAAVLAAASLSLSGCQDEDFGYTASEITYKTNFKKTFGSIDPEHTWNTASQCKVNINVPASDNLGATCKVQIYTCDPRSGQKAYLLADLDTKPGSNLSFDLDYPAGQSALAFGLIAEDGGRVIHSAEIVNGRCDMSFAANLSATRAGGMNYQVPTAYNYTQITSFSTSKTNDDQANNIPFELWRATNDNWTFTSHEDLMGYFNICPEAPSMVSVTPGLNTYADIAKSGKTTSFMFASHGPQDDIVITPVFGCTSNQNTLGFYILDTEGSLVSDYVILSTDAKSEMEFSSNTNDVAGNFIDNRLATNSNSWYGSWITAGGDGTAADVVNNYKNNNMFLNTGGTTRSHSWVLRGIPADYRICFYLIQGKSTITDNNVAYTEQTKNPWIEKGADGSGTSDKDYIACLDDAIKNNIYTYREGVGFGYYDARASLVTVNDALAYIGFEDAWSSGKHWSGAEAYDINDIVIQISGVSTVDYSSSNIDEAEFLVACEDLGDLNDFDFNDVVFSVNPKIVTTDGGSSVSKTIKFGLKASGGTLPLYVYYTPTEEEDASVYYDGTGTTLDHKIGDGQPLKTVNIFGKSGAATSDEDPDTHTVFGVLTTEPVNVNAEDGKTKPAVVSNVVVRDASFTVTEPKQLSIVVDQTNGSQGNYGASVGCMKNSVGRTEGVVEIPVTATTPGQVPKAFIVGDATWQWHDENVSMANDADFVAWAANHTDNRWYKYVKGSFNIKTITTIDDVTKDAYPTFTHIPASVLSSYNETGCVIKFNVSTGLAGLNKYPAVTLCHYPNDYKALNIPVYIETTDSRVGDFHYDKNDASKTYTLYNHTLGDKRTYYVELSPEDVQAAISTTAGDGSTTVEGGIMLNGSLLAVDSYEVLSYAAAGATKEATKISDFTTYAAVSFLPEPTTYPTSAAPTATLEADAFADYTYCGLTGANIIVELQNMKSNSVLAMQVFDGTNWVTKKTYYMAGGEEYAVIHLSTRCIQEIFKERYANGSNGVRFALTGGDHTSNIAHTYVTSEDVVGCTNPSDLTIVNSPITIGRGKSITIHKGVDFTTSSSAAITLSVGTDANNDISSIVDNGNGSWTITMSTNSEASTPTIKVTQAAQAPTYGGGTKTITLNYDPGALDPATLTVTSGTMSIKVGESKALNECTSIPTYNKGDNTSGAITFSTDDTDIIEVNETTGAVTAKATGNATVKINQASDGIHMAASLAYVTVSVSAPDLSTYGTVLNNTSTAGEVSASNYWINNDYSYYIDSRSFNSYASAIISVYIDEVNYAVKTSSVNGGTGNMNWAEEKNWAWLDSESQSCSKPTKAGIYSFVLSSSDVADIKTNKIPGIKIEGAKILTIAVKGVEESPISVPESVTINMGDDQFSAYIDVNRNGASGTISVEKGSGTNDIAYSIDGNRITFIANSNAAAGTYIFDVKVSSDAQYAAGTKRVNVIVSTLRSPNLQLISGVPVAQLTSKGQTAELEYTTSSTGAVTVDQPANGCATISVDQANHKIIVTAVKTGTATINVRQEGVTDAYSADLKTFDIDVLISLTPFPMDVATPVTLSATSSKDSWTASFNKWIDLSAYSMPAGANYLKVQFSNTDSPGGFGYQIGSTENNCNNNYGANSYFEISDASVISSIFDNGGILLGYWNDVDFGTVTITIESR